jgi:homotetrameric cytidine deaminase
MEVTARLAKEDFHGLCFVNLVDFDMVYGHRNDISGYAKAFAEFDTWLATFLPLLGEDDALIITADHGCDPGDDSTDHTREYVPCMMYGKKLRYEKSGGTRPTFADVSAYVCDMLGVEYHGAGKIDRSCLELAEDRLLEIAKAGMSAAYAPYSGYKVGAALLDESGQIWRGCNVENASYGATICAERTAFTYWAQTGAAAEGRKPVAIAVVGGKDGVITDFAPPCGICRQVMMEFCDPDTFRIILTNGKEVRSYTLAELLPLGFGPSNLD